MKTSSITLLLISPIVPKIISQPNFIKIPNAPSYQSHEHASTPSPAPQAAPQTYKYAMFKDVNVHMLYQYKHTYTQTAHARTHTHRRMRSRMRSRMRTRTPVHARAGTRKNARTLAQRHAGMQNIGPWHAGTQAGKHTDRDQQTHKDTNEKDLIN